MKKRICFLVDSIFSIGGVQRVTAVIAKYLANDYDVTITTFDNPERKDLTLYSLEEANLRYRFFSYPPIKKHIDWIRKVYSGLYMRLHPKSKWMSNLYSYSSFPYELRKALTKELQQGKYDIIIGVHAPLAARLATIRKSLPNVKVIGWIHNSFEALFGDTFIYIGKDRKRHYVYQFKKLDELVLLCHHDVESYQSYDDAIRPSVIYNPLTLVPGRLSEGTSKRFLAVGRFSHHHKGFDLLIKAFHLFSHINTDWKLDIVGEGPEEGMYYQLITEYKLSDRIFIHPFTKYIQTYYSNAQIYILSSRWEGFGLVLVEAMSHGLPIVSSDLPTSKEIMGDFGMFFKNGDIEELAQRLEDATHLDWQKKSDEAIAIAQRFDVNEIAGQWKQLLK